MSVEIKCVRYGGIEIDKLYISTVQHCSRVSFY